MKSSTELLRAKLDELGIKWWPSDNPCCEDVITHWCVGPFQWTAIEGEKDLWLNAGIARHEPLAPEQAIAATVGAGTCEPWDMRSNHAVQAANEQKVDERNTVPETKYLMALDEAREARKDAERWERIARDRKSMCESLKETNADLRRIIERIKEDK